MNDLILQRAKEIVNFHIERASWTTGAYLSPNSELNSILLVETDSGCPTTDEVLPFTLSNQSKLIILSKEELESVKAGKLKLPDGWGDINSFITLFERELDERDPK
jgi:hypothetical protein